MKNESYIKNGYFEKMNKENENVTEFVTTA